jgi:hypothetical protein
MPILAYLHVLVLIVFAAVLTLALASTTIAGKS